MTSSRSSRVTQLLEKFEPGDREATEQLFVDVYGELRAIATGYLRRERKDHTLRPTALVHEVYLKLVDQTRVAWRGQAHFLAIAAQAMRRILVDHARRRAATKRGGNRHRIALDDNVAIESNRDEDVLELDAALTKLTKLDQRQAHMIELRFFGGLNIAEVAKVTGISKRSAEREWTMVRAWLRRELSTSDRP
jgi:RNA polymerase sigma factor (TIGR02999 family)